MRDYARRSATLCGSVGTGFSKRAARDLKARHGSRSTRPLIAFAGLWTPWTGTRGTKANSIEGEHKL